MKYEFIRLDEDNIKLKYKDKEFTFKVNVKLISEMQKVVMESRIKLIEDLAEKGKSVKNLTIEIKKDGKTYYDNSNKQELEQIYQEQEYLKFFDNKCQEIFNMDLQSLIDDIGLNDEEAEIFGKELTKNMSGKTPLPKRSRE